jgi:hypothetical protein
MVPKRVDGVSPPNHEPSGGRRGESMFRFRHSVVPAVLAAALLSWACDDNATPVTPTTDPTTFETFSGELTINGARAFPFSTLAGRVTATLTSLGPDSPVVVGFSLGIWSNSVCSTSAALSIDSAVQGSVIIGEAGTAGSLCARIYDVGNLTEPLPFVLTVEHP